MFYEMDYQSQGDFYAAHQKICNKRYPRLTRHCTTLIISVNSWPMCRL